MGTSVSCDRDHSSLASSCSSLQDAYVCRYTSDTSEPRTQHECHTNASHVFLYVFLPLLLGLLLLITLTMYIKYTRLTKIRESHRSSSHSSTLISTESTAVEHGRYAAGEEVYSFSNDIFPYLLPNFMQRERPIYRVMICLVIFCFILSMLLLTLGFVINSEQGLHGLPWIILGFVALVIGVKIAVISWLVRACTKQSPAYSIRYESSHAPMPDELQQQSMAFQSSHPQAQYQAQYPNYNQSR